MKLRINETKLIPIIAVGILAVLLAVWFFTSNNANIIGAEPTKENTQEVVNTGESFLRVAMPKKINSINPLLTNNLDMVNLLWLTYESPLYMEADGKIQTGLVESWTNEGNVYNFKIRNNAYWQGTEKNVTAADIKYSIDTIKAGSSDPDKTQARNTIYAMTKSNIVGTQVVGDFNIKVTFASPSLNNLYAMVFPVVPSSGANNVGSGSYAISTYDPNVGISFIAHERSWKKQPEIKEIVATAFDTTIDAMKAANENKLDVIFTNYKEAGKFRYLGNFNTVVTQANNYLYIVPNKAKYSVNFKKAIANAVNREDLMADAYDGYGVASDIPVPPGHYRYNSNLMVYNNDKGEMIKYFIADGYEVTKNGSKNIITKDGTQLTIKLLVLDNGETQRYDLAKAVKRQLDHVGALVTIDYLKSADYNKALTAGNYDLTIMNNEIEKDFDLRNVLNNDFGVDITTAIKNSKDEKELMNLYYTLQTNIINELPHLGVGFPGNVMIVNKRVRGVENGPYYNMAYNVFLWNFVPVSK